jgi:ribosomal protein L32
MTQEQWNQYQQQAYVDSQHQKWERESQLPQQEICISCDEKKETHKICMDCIGKMINENQQEISDEEIEKAFTIETAFQTTKYMGEIRGAKWYREQLKKQID